MHRLTQAIVALVLIIVALLVYFLMPDIPYLTDIIHVIILIALLMLGVHAITGIFHGGSLMLE